MARLSIFAKGVMCGSQCSLNVAMLTFSGGIRKSAQFHLGNICKIGKYLTMTPYGNTYTCFCEF